MEETPLGWQIVELSRICELVNGDRGKNYPSKEKLSNEGYPFVNAGHLKNNRISNDGMNFIDEHGFSLLNSGKFGIGDILFCIRGSLGKVALNTQIESGAIASSLIIIRPHHFIMQKYVLYYLASPLTYDMINKFDNGTAQPNLAGADLGRFELPLAPYNEQKRIVAKLEELFSELEKGIENLKTAREQLKVYRQAVLKHAFEGKLTVRWREQNKNKLETVDQLLERIRAERDAYYRMQLEKWKEAIATWERNGKEGKKPTQPKSPDEIVPLGKEEVKQVPILPQGWIWIKLSNISKSIQIGPFGSLLHQHDYVVDGWPLVNPSHIKNQQIYPDNNLTVTTEKLEELANYRLQEGDVIMGRRGEMGRCAVVTKKEAGWLCGTGSLFVRLLDGYSSWFYCQALSSQRAKEYLSSSSIGTTMQNLNQKILEEMPIPVCSVEEQSEIMIEIQRQFSIIGGLEETINTELQKAEALRQSILKKAFSGNLVEQDPNDEPASMLLERIRAEKKVHPLNHKNNHQHEIKPVNKYAQGPLFQETAV